MRVTTASTSSGGRSLSAFLIFCSGVRFTVLLLIYRYFLIAAAIESSKQFLDRFLAGPFVPDFFQPARIRRNLSRHEVFERKSWFTKLWYFSIFSQGSPHINTSVYFAPFPPVFQDGELPTASTEVHRTRNRQRGALVDIQRPISRLLCQAPDPNRCSSEISSGRY